MTDLNHPKVKPLTREIATALGLDSAFIDFVLAKSRPACFEYLVESVDQTWTSYLPECVDLAYSLWSTNADQTLVCVGQNRSWFMRGHHDAPEAYDIARTVQGLLADLFIAMYESEATLDELREAAQSCGFRYLGDVVSLVESSGRDHVIWETEKQRVIEEIDGKHS